MTPSGPRIYASLTRTCSRRRALDEAAVRLMPDKVALVVGGASGIGRATAEAFLRLGYRTALADLNAELGQQVETELRGTGDCTFFPCDVTDDASVAAAVAGATSMYGR